MNLKSLRKKISKDLNGDLDGIKQRLVRAEQRISSGPYLVEEKFYLRLLLLNAVTSFEEVKKPHQPEGRRDFHGEAREMLEKIEAELERLDGQKPSPCLLHNQ